MLNKSAINQGCSSASKLRFAELRVSMFPGWLLLQLFLTASCHSDSGRTRMDIIEKQ